MRRRSPASSSLDGSLVRRSIGTWRDHVEGEVRLRTGRAPDAALLVKLGILTGGVGIGRDGIDVHLFRPYRWFRNELSRRSARR